MMTMIMKRRWNDVDRRKAKYRNKWKCHATTKPHGLARGWTGASTMKGRG